MKRPLFPFVGGAVLFASRLAWGQVTGSAFAAATPEPDTTEVERVIVTGSNIPTAEEVGPNPVDTYRTDDLNRIGVRTADDFQQKIPALTGVASNQGINNGSDGRTEVNLRGLLPKETLVLVDGRRVAPVGFAQDSSVDLNLVPFPLIDHVDILKDGASAIYGSDAVGGVINLVLRHSFHDTEIGSSYGNTNLGASNDAAERDAYILTGTGNGKTEIVFYSENYDRDAIYARDRDLTSTANFRRFGGLDARSLNFPGQVIDFGPDGSAFDQYILRPGLTTPTPRSATDVTNSPDYIPVGDVPDRFRGFDYARFIPTAPPADRHYYYGSLTQEILGKTLEFYADAKVAYSKFVAVFAPVPFDPDPFKKADGETPVSPFGISVPLSNPFNPFTTADATLPDGTPVTLGVTYREFGAGPRTFTITTDDYLYDAGLRGNLGQLGDYFKNGNFDFGFRYNENDHSEIATGLVNLVELRQALLDPNPATAFNPFTRAGNPPAAFERFLTGGREDGRATLIDGLGIITGDLFSLPAGPVSFAVGTEFREETIDDRVDKLTANFQTIGSTNLQPTKARRAVDSYFGELRIPVTSPSWNLPGLHSLEFDLAERIESYSDIGTSERPKFSVRYQPLDSSLTLRATYSEAFHAPNLSDLSPSAVEQFGAVFDPEMRDAQGHPTQVDTVVFLGGQPNLRPEVAYGWNYGLVYSPKFVNGLTISVDYYHIDLRNRTDFIDPQFIVDQNFLSDGRQFPGQIIRDPVTGKINLIRDLVQNIHSTITEGIDYELIYAFATSRLGRGNFGTFTFTLNGNYLSRYVATIFATDQPHEYAGQEADFFGYLPHNRLYTSLFYDLGGLDAGVTVHYVGQTSEPPYEGLVLGKPQRKVRESTSVDAVVSYTFKYPQPAAQTEVSGYAKDGGKDAGSSDNKGKTPAPVATANYGRWKNWLNGITITLGMNNIFDTDPPFRAITNENGFDESAFNGKGRYYYVALKKRF